MPALENLPRDTDGSLPAFAWPGGYPVTYLTESGSELCPGCANAEILSEECDDPVIAGDVFWEGTPSTCDECGKVLESAYGDPDDD